MSSPTVAEGSQIMARLAAEKIAERRSRAAHPCDHVDGYHRGGSSENIASPLLSS